MATSEADITDVVHRLHGEIWNEGNTDLVDDIVAEDYVEHNPTVPHDIRGPADYKDNVERVRTAFPDLTFSEEDTFAEDDKVVSRVRLKGTHEGELLDVDPTGETVDVRGIVINQFENGKLVESWPLVDLMAVMTQLGVVESP